MERAAYRRTDVAEIAAPGRWTFAFWSPDGSLGVVQALTVRPGGAGLHVAVVGADRRPVVLADDGVPRPRDRRYLEVRSHGVWAHHVCEEPGRRFTLGLEAFALVHDDPTDGLGQGWGERTGLALDVDWEATGPVLALAGGEAQPGVVHGEVLVGHEAWDATWVAWRTHRPGRLDPGSSLEAAVVRRSAWVAGEGGHDWSGGYLPPGGVVEDSSGRALAVAPWALATWATASAATATGLVRATLDDATTAVGWATWRTPRA